MPRRPALQPVQLQTVKPSLTQTQMFADVSHRGFSLPTVRSVEAVSVLFLVLMCTFLCLLLQRVQSQST